MNLPNLNTKWCEATRTHELLLRYAGKAFALSLLFTQTLSAAQTVGPVTSEATNKYYPGKVIRDNLLQPSQLTKMSHRMKRQGG